MAIKSVAGFGKIEIFRFLNSASERLYVPS